MITQRNEIEDDNLKYLNFHLRRDYKRGYNIFLIREMMMMMMIFFTKVYSLFIGLRSEKQPSESKWQKLKRQQLKILSH
jgi:hypothetical protein